MKNLLFALAATCLGFGSFAQNKAPGFTAISLQATPAYVYHHGNTCRMARLLFHGGKQYETAIVQVHYNGLDVVDTLPAGSEGITEAELPLPGDTLTHTVQLEVQLHSGTQQFTARCLVPPAKQWKVYVLPHSHVDIGYTDVQEKVLQIHMNNIDEAITIARRTAGYPADARFKWNTEANWVVDNYLTRADAEKKKIFWDAVQKGWINLDGAYGNTNTSATSARQLMQLFYTGKQLAAQHGIAINTMLQCDVPGMSWGLPAQADITGIRYVLSAPNASDRIGSADEWRDKPFYWRSPSGMQQLLFWQCSPYSIGYTLKGSKIPNFFTVENPQPFYTGKPAENFLNPYLFGYLNELESKNFPYNSTILTWAMSDNAPIDPELPDAVKAWNGHYASPHLVITSVGGFFADIEAQYKHQLPVVAGDYTEYWTDGIASAARETGINRIASEEIQQAGALWALRNKPAYPAAAFDSAYNNLLLFNEHTWGAYNSVSNPADPKVTSEWKYKQAFALRAKAAADALLQEAEAGEQSIAGNIDVYNTLAQPQTGLVKLPAAQSSAGDLVKNAAGKPVPSQRLSTGELVFVAADVPGWSKQRFRIHAGKAYTKLTATVNGSTLDNGIYQLTVSDSTGNIISLYKKGIPANLAGKEGLNRYTYLPGDSLSAIQYAGAAQVSVKEKGPLVVSLLVTSSAPGAKTLRREIQLVAGIDRVDITNTIDKLPVGSKESVYFVFPFNVPGAQLRYQIPWGSITAEADQLTHANKNWYTMQRWADVSNKDYGITWSSIEAPLFETGNYTTAGLIGGLHHSPRWVDFTEQGPVIASWVMNNVWHTNFRREQEGITRFHYYLHAHETYSSINANQLALADHQPLVAAAASGAANESLFFNVSAPGVYVENLQPAAAGKGVLLQLVNAADTTSAVHLTPASPSKKMTITRSSLLEQDAATLQQNFTIPAKGIVMIRVQQN